ncbi:MAG: hypothetical protein IPK79_05290 [Vampirovibrionales bacterium]|nr:hypothetical protein [Vampirovibrionales bacterium]
MAMTLLTLCVVSPPPLTPCARAEKPLAVDASTAFSDRLLALTRRLQAVSTGEKNGFRRSIGILRESVTPQDSLTFREHAVDVWLQSYYERAMTRGDLLEALGVSQPLNRSSQLSAIRRQVRPLGFEAHVEDGAVAQIPRFSLLRRRLGDLAGPAWRSYWALQAEEIDRPLEIEGLPAVPWDQMRRRLTAREQFLTLYPHFVRRRDVDCEREWILLDYVGALDPAVLADSRQRPRADALASYALFLERNRDSHSFGLIRDYRRLLLGQGDKLDVAAVRAFLDAQNLPKPSFRAASSGEASPE